MSKRSTGSFHPDAERHTVTFRAFDEDHHVVLERNQWLISPGLEVEYLQPDGSTRKEPVQSSRCHFLATSISHKGSKGALSTCSGLRGVLSLEDDMLFIEPLKEEHARRIRRYTDVAIHPHLIYKRQATDEKEAFCPGAVLPVTDNGGIAGTMTLSDATVYDGPYLGRKIIEVFYVVDKLVYDEHLTGTESYATTILNIMSRRFADPSLDIDVRFSVVRLLISMTTTITATSPSGNVESITPTEVADTTLPEFCTWQAALSLNNDTDPNDWDLALLFTGHDIYRDNMEYVLQGRARLGGTCDVNNKCSVTENTGLSSGLTMAHETGHSLGVQHDVLYGCEEGVNIMATASALSSGAMEWSSCSSEHMKMFISSRGCMDDVPLHSLADIFDIPGQDLNEQCRQVMEDPDAESCQTITNCTKLYCTLPGSSSCRSNSVPAEGSPCGDLSGNMRCINTECVSASIALPAAVDGGWTEFGAEFSSCSRSCGTGVQYRSRACTNPRPQWGGAPCEGQSHIYKICNEQPCMTSQDDYRDEQCASTNSIPLSGVIYEWTDYQHSTFLGDEVCEKSCLTTGTSGLFRSDRPGNFHDGTLCWQELPSDVAKSFEFTKSLCLNGKCQQNFGCDGVLDSGLVYDDCHVCDGDGSSCDCTSLELTSWSSTGESVIATIPIGATSITADSYGDSHFLGLRVNGDFIFGINTTGLTLTSGGDYKIGNMVVNYDRTFQVETHIRSLSDPSSETLDILLWTSITTGLNVKLNYCLPVFDPCDSSPLSKWRNMLFC
nr:A disintegrin and metalloproteinase with thrombospondin motifs 7-like [Lytechinus pictus]